MTEIHQSLAEWSIEWIVPESTEELLHHLLSSEKLKQTIMESALFEGINDRDGGRVMTQVLSEIDTILFGLIEGKLESLIEENWPSEDLEHLVNEGWSSVANGMEVAFQDNLDDLVEYGIDAYIHRPWMNLGASG